MLRQYRAGRFRYVDTPRGRLPVGTIPVGAIIRPHNCLSNVQVVAWIPRDYSTYDRDPITGRRNFVTKRITGGHLALVRSLADGKTFHLSDAWLIDAEERA